MFRGNIDFASRTRIEGWVHCSRWSLVGARVHAFIDEACVGSGVVDLFRQDLVTAGVGDGLGGFNFAICLQESQDPRSLHIRVEDGNAIIRQPGSRLVLSRADGSAGRRWTGEVMALPWMLSRGWITVEQLPILKDLAQFGVHQQPIEPITPDVMDSNSLETLSRSAGQIMELLAFAPVTAVVQMGLAEGEFARQRRRLHAAFPSSPPVIALLSPRPSCLNVVEASHVSDTGLGAPIAGGVDYDFGPNQLLWINLDCDIRIPTGVAASAWAALIPSR